MRRQLLLGGGVVAFALAVAAALGYTPFGVRPGRVVVQVVGLAALLQALRIARSRRGSLRPAETHDPERPVPSPPPGASVEDVLSSYAPARSGSRQRATRLQQGLHEVAVAVLTRFDGAAEEAARADLREGGWTSDPYAAALLCGPEFRDVPLSARIRSAVAGETAFGRGVSGVVAELEARIPGREDGKAGERSTADEHPRPVRPAGVTGRRQPGESGRPTRGRSADRLRTRNRVAGGRGARRRVPGRRPAGGRADGGLTATDGDEPDESWETGRWNGVGAVALAGVGVGVVAGQPAPVLAGVVGIGFAAFARSGTTPEAAIAVERRVSDRHPAPGDRVAVTVTVRNEGERYAPDLRVVDGVPPALAVVEGSPRHGTALRPGEATTFSYVVRARRGVHAFDPALVLAHDLSGAIGRERLVASETEDELTCVPATPATDVRALRRGLTRYAGRQATDVGGQGVEFHTTREYRADDPRNRIDWNRWARTGELATVEFRTERAARVAIVVDARASAYCAPDHGSAHAVDRSVDAAGRLFAGLLAGGDRVGLGALSPADCWLAPATGATHRARARRLLARHPAFSPVPPGPSTNLWRAGLRLRRRLRSGTGVVVLTPLVDDGAVRTVRTLAASGHPVTVVSPDPTAADAPARKLARVTRSLRVSSLREAGIRVADWRPDETLDAALARAARRWSA